MAEILNKWKQALNRTSKAAFGRLATVFGATEISESTWEDLEALLIQADLGVPTTQEIITGSDRVAGASQRAGMDAMLRENCSNGLTPPALDFSAQPPAVIRRWCEGSERPHHPKLVKKFSRWAKSGFGRC